LISNEYKETLTKIHDKTKFGKRRKLPDYLEQFIHDNDPESILDFGCGKGNLVTALTEKYSNKKIYGYDPANRDYDNPLFLVDMIISTDVLEHVEPLYLDKTLQEIYNNSNMIYHLISCAPAKLILPDGRNAHLIQETPDWWRSKFKGLGYNIIKEDYREFSKFSKQLNRNLPVKNYIIMAEK